jgi:hypothetical protein
MATTQGMAPLPGVILTPGMMVTLEALDPATSLAVAGVTVARVAFTGRRLLATLDELVAGPFLLVPGGPTE